jgi:hypothetical protein
MVFTRQICLPVILFCLISLQILITDSSSQCSKEQRHHNYGLLGYGTIWSSRCLEEPPASVFRVEEVQWNGRSRLCLLSYKVSHSTRADFIFTTMETFNLLLFISSRILWMMWCKKHVKRQSGMLTFAYFMVYMVYVTMILHYLKYGRFLMIIINVGIICNTDFNHSSQKQIHSISFFNGTSHETGLSTISGCCRFFLHHKPQNLRGWRYLWGTYRMYPGLTVWQAKHSLWTCTLNPCTMLR